MPEKKEERLTLRKKDEVVVRMYGQGFGDCFLLAFPRQGMGVDGLQEPAYILIDSGVFFGSPGESERLKAVAQNISDSTGGEIDLLVATHEHYDHLSGFNAAKGIWKNIAVRRIWLAWTENMQDKLAKKYQDTLEHQAEIKKLAIDLVGSRPALTQELQRIAGVTEFAADTKTTDDKKLKAPDKFAASMDRVLDAFARSPKDYFKSVPETQVDFCDPGDVLKVPETGVDAYVLGPPKDEAALATEVDPDVYSESAANQQAENKDRQKENARRNGLAAASNRAELETMGSAIRRHWLQGIHNGTADERDENMPFRETMSLPYASVRQHPFFQNHYFKASYERQIEDDWLYGFSRFALQVDQVINNTSLVLAFRLPNGNVLLFPGDAQGGNWRSWFDIRREDWRRPDGGQVKFKPLPVDLIKRTVVYKVGHHGSHNATLMKAGLEQMPAGVIAFVPVSRSYPQKDQGWSIPLPSLVEALKRKTGGRLVFPDKERSCRDYTDTKYQPEAVFQSAEKRFDDDKELPLWRQVRI